MNKKFLVAILAASLALQASADVQLVPAGEFDARDGRPGKGQKWKLTDEQGRALAAMLNARHGAGQAAFGLDYEHQTVLARKNGQPAPASGWVNEFEWRAGQGLYALNVRWTERAKAMIGADEYRYISPMLAFDEVTYEVTDVFNAALTNFPAVLQQDPVNQAVASLNAQFSSNPNQPENDMALLAALAALLNMAPTTTEPQALAAVTALKAKAEAPPPTRLSAAITSALGLSAEVEEATALSAIAELKTKTASPGTDAATVQMVQELHTQVAALTNQLNTASVTALVDDALKAGKLLPAQRDWAVKLGSTDIAQLSAFIAAAPVVAAGLGTQQSNQNGAGAGTQGGAGGVAALTSDELKVCQAMGLKPEDYALAAPKAA